MKPVVSLFQYLNLELINFKNISQSNKR